jgi:acyl-coenzyme A synthetase/AMP-(fatty) acid ligase
LFAHDVVPTPTIRWVVGHSYVVYGPLLQGCTSILFEGKPVGTPDAGEYWRIAEKYKVTIDPRKNRAHSQELFLKLY